MRRGFTLLEVLVVLGLIASIASFSVYEGVGSYERFLAHTEIDQLNFLQEIARGKVIRRICSGTSCTNAAPHGIHVEPSGSILFEGPSYAGRDVEGDFFLPHIHHSTTTTDYVYVPGGALGTGP